MSECIWFEGKKDKLCLHHSDKDHYFKKCPYDGDSIKCKSEAVTRTKPGRKDD